MTIIATAPVPGADLSTVDTTNLTHVTDAAAHLDRVQAAWNRELHPWWCQSQFAVGCGAHDSRTEWIAATGSDREAGVTVGVSAHMNGSGQAGVALYLEGAQNTTDIVDAILTIDQAERLMDLLMQAGILAHGPAQMGTRPEWPAGGAK